VFLGIEGLLSWLVDGSDQNVRSLFRGLELEERIRMWFRGLAFRAEVEIL